jgi:hypothetical protein
MLRTAFFVLVASVALYAGACSSDDEPLPNEELADVIYQGTTNDEALELLLTSTPVDDPTNEAELVWPPDGDSVPASPPPTFCWTVGAGASLAPMTPAIDPGWLDEIVGMRSAHAHGPPVNGPAYFVVFSTPSDPKLARVFTSEVEYTPDDAVWQKMIAVGGPITCTITTGIFDNNLLAADGGPFVGDSTTFTITQ